MKSLVFAHLNKAQLIVTGYHQFRIGPYLRGEKSKRKYHKYFTFQKSLLFSWLEGRRVNALLTNVIKKEQPLKEVKNSGVVCFENLPQWDDYFQHLNAHRPLVIDLLWNTIRPEIKVQVNKKTQPTIGVHIRMGDFRKLQTGQDFSKVGATRTPEDYFIDVINGIRKIHGSNLPVHVFTDGYRHEFKKLFTLPEVTMIEGNPDIVDLLLLSRSKLIVTSAGSTFSYWAGFLSESPIIMHPDHIHQPLRIDKKHELYEGPFDPCSKILVEMIKQLAC